jgi:hypothetical protein
MPAETVCAHCLKHPNPSLYYQICCMTPFFIDFVALFGAIGVTVRQHNLPVYSRRCLLHAAALQ